MKTRLIVLSFALAIVVGLIIITLLKCPCVNEFAEFFGYQCVPI